MVHRIFPKAPFFPGLSGEMRTGGRVRLGSRENG
jgi:hypothetical protein